MAYGSSELSEFSERIGLNITLFDYNISKGSKAVKEILEFGEYRGFGRHYSVKLYSKQRSIEMFILSVWIFIIGHANYFYSEHHGSLWEL